MKLIKDLGTRPTGKNKIFMRRFGLYECPICEKHFEVMTNSVKQNKSKKCRNCASSTHGYKKHKLYRTWNNMMQRCYNEKNKNFANYGGRGINVCDEWQNVEIFIHDMETCFIEGMEIDRINNNGNYEPSNCRWASRTTQCRNTRMIQSDNTSGYRGVTFHNTEKKYRSQIGIDRTMKMIGRFNTAEEAGYAYDKYVIDNNLEHTTNGLYKKEIF